MSTQSTATRSCYGLAPSRRGSRLVSATIGGLTSVEVRHIIADVDGTADIVGFTIAEFIPRQVMRLQQLLSGFPLISGTTAG